MQRPTLYKLCYWLFGSKELPFQYTHHIVLCASAVVYIFSVFFNYFLGISDATNIALQMLFVPVIIWIWYQSRWQNKFYKMAIAFAYVVSLVTLPANWLGNGGSSGPTYLMGMASLIYVSVLLRDVKFYRRLGQILILLVPLPLICIENFYPDAIFAYPDNTLRQIDLTVSFLLAGFVVTIIMENHFRRFKLEREKADYLTEQLRFLSEQDPLTGLYNRRGLDRYFSEKMNHNAPLSMLFLDLDHFKKVNDQWGHSYGDDVLCSFSTLLKNRAIKDKGIAVRFGGEEFVLLLPLTLNMAMNRASTVELEFSELGLPNGAVTFSAGVIEIEKHETPENALERADHLLYKAKQSGRNLILGS